MKGIPLPPAGGPQSLLARVRYTSQLVRVLVPEEYRGRPLKSTAIWLQGLATLGLLAVNESLIARFAPDLPVRWSPTTYDWSDDLVAAFPDIRDEVLAYLESGSMPHTAELTGVDHATDEGKFAVNLDYGAWRSLPLVSYGTVVHENAAHFPLTMRAIARMTDVNSIGFTALDPRSHLAEHVGPNRGALRYQLPIIVPDPPASCRIRVADEMIVWDEGEPVVFDLAIRHEAWNDSDAVRVLMMIEVATPLPGVLSLVNRVAQSYYRYFPPLRGFTERAAEMGRRHGSREPSSD